MSDPLSDLAARVAELPAESAESGRDFGRGYALAIRHVLAEIELAHARSYTDWQQAALTIQAARRGTAGTDTGRRS